VSAVGVDAGIGTGGGAGAATTTGTGSGGAGGGEVVAHAVSAAAIQRTNDVLKRN